MSAAAEKTNRIEATWIDHFLVTVSSLQKHFGARVGSRKKEIKKQTILAHCLRRTEPTSSNCLTQSAWKERWIASNLEWFIFLIIYQSIHWIELLLLLLLLWWCDVMWTEWAQFGVQTGKTRYGERREEERQRQHIDAPLLCRRRRRLSMEINWKMAAPLTPSQISIHLCLQRQLQHLRSSSLTPNRLPLCLVQISPSFNCFLEWFNRSQFILDKFLDYSIGLL